MRRPLFLATGLGLLTGTILYIVLQPGELPAQPVKSDTATAVKAVPPQAPLPVSTVILFSSGVGYFQREGEVEGNARIDLSFPVEDINDLLKSMVLRDLGGGHVSAVSYDSHDPIDRTLRSFAINLTANPSFAQILGQVRGEKIEVVMQQTNVTQPAALTGTIVGIETQKQTAGKDATVDVEVLNLWCADGLRACKLSDVQRVRFLNPVLDNELRRALEVLSLSHDTQKKVVTVNFTGEGKRPVRVGYVVENPIWKTSYRLVLNKEGKPFLQGWAVVENTSDDDWNNVNMSLVSGRPISYLMDLYAPLYLRRPVVEPDLFASLRPPTYSGAMSGKEQILHLGNTVHEAKVVAKNGQADAFVPLTVPAGEDRAGSITVPAPRTVVAFAKPPRSHEPMNLAKGVASAATAAEMGDFFQYLIEHPVTLPRQKSALLPIVNEAVEGKRVSIYNQATHAKFPLLGLQFKNTSGLHLMQGPITVFDGNSYAGDARIQDLQPKEERLLGYAIDLGMEVAPEGKSHADEMRATKIIKGVLHTTRKLRDTRTYVIKNRTEQDRTLVLEHPLRMDWTLVAPEKPTERSRDVYRFQLSVPAGKSVTQEVIEEQQQASEFSVSGIDGQTTEFFLKSTATSPKLKEALEKVVALKTRLATTQREIADSDRQLKEISTDQGRLRANLKELPPTAAAYKRYLEKFDTQETEIEKLQEQIKKQRLTEETQRKELEAFVAGLEA